MTDFLHNELAVGDTVVLIAPGYRHLVKAEITAFTPQKVRVRFMNTWNYGFPGYETHFLQDPEQLVKI